MYNGIGLQTPRGSGTNGYIQTNKFFIRPRDGKPSSEGRGFEDDQGTAGISKKPNKDILEHDRKRQIHLKLVVLEDKLIEQGYTDAEIGDKLDEARKVLEAASASDSAGGLSGDAKHSDTQTHQIAARKERQMEVLRGALGIKMSDPDPELEMGELVEDRKSRAGERREHSFLDRDYSRKKEEAIKDEKKGSKKKAKGEDADELKHGGKRRHRGGSSESDGGAKRGRRGQVARRKGKEESEDENDSDSDDGKRTRTRKKLKKSRKDSGSDSSASEDSGSDFYKKKIVSSRSKQRRHDSGSDDESSSSDDDSDTGRKEKKRVKHRRHGSETDESKSDSDSSDSGGSDSDHKKTKRKTAVKKSKSSSRRRHASDDDSSSDSEPTHKTHEAKKGMTTKMRHDSDSDSDADPKLQRKLKNNQVSRGHINAVDEDPKKSRRHDSDAEDSDGPTSKDMGRQVERSKETHKGERGNPRSSLLEGRRSAYNDDRRRDGHELIDRYQPEKDDEVELSYDRELTLSKRKLDDNEQPELKPSRRSRQDDDTRGRDGEYQNKDAHRDHHARSERPTRRDNEEHLERKSSQQCREDDESPDTRRADHSRSARPPKPVAKYQGRATKDENTGRESRRNDLSDAERHRSEKSNAWDEEDKKGKDIKREEVDDESMSKQRSDRNGEDLKSKRYNKDEVDGRARRSSRDEEDLPRNIRQRGREEEEGRRGRVREKSSKDEEDLSRTIRQRGREEEEGRRGRGHEGSSKDEEDLPRNSRQRGREEEERHGRDLEPREENKPHISRRHGRDEEEERHDRDHPRDGQLDHFKRPRYDKRNDDRARFRD